MTSALSYKASLDPLVSLLRAVNYCESSLSATLADLLENRRATQIGFPFPLTFSSSGRSVNNSLVP